MVTIAEIMTKEVATLEPEMTLREAVEVLAAAGASGAPVMAGGRVIGVLSRTDILDLQSTRPGVPIQRENRSEWGELVSVDEREEAAEEPSAYFADFWDDAGADVWQRFEHSESLDWDVLEEHSVSEVMTRKVIGLPPGASVQEAARLMIENRIHRILVMRDEDLAGILTSTDLMRAIADGRLGGGS